MSKDYEGGSFCAINNEALSADQPLDTFIDNALRSNSIWILNHGSQVSYTSKSRHSDDLDSSDGIRPFASLDYSSVLNVPWIYQPDLTSIDVSMIARVAGDDGSDPSGASKVTVRLSAPALDAETVEDLANTDDSTPEFQGVTLSPLTIERELTAPFLGDLRLDLRSEVYGLTTASSASLGILGGSRVRGTTNFYRDSDSGVVRPDTTDLHIQITEAPDDEGLRYDHLGATDDETMRVRPSGGSTILAESPDGARRRRLSYLQLRGLEIRETFDGSAGVLPGERYRALKPVEGQESSSHALANRAAARRWKCVHVGPQGDINADSDPNWPDGYGYRFERLLSPNGASYDNLTLHSYMSDFSDPTIRVLMHLVPIHKAYTVNSLDFGSLLENSSDCNWTFRVSVHQYQSNLAPVELVSKDFTDVPLVHYPLDGRGLSAFLLTERHLQLGKAGGSQPYKEGQLFKEDLSLLQRFDFSLEVPLTQPDERALIVRVDAQPDDSSIVWGNGEANNISDLGLVLTGTTTWERGTL